MKINRRAPSGRSRLFLLLVLCIGILVGVVLWRRPALSLGDFGTAATMREEPHVLVDDGVVDDPLILMKPDPVEALVEDDAVRNRHSGGARGDTVGSSNISRSHYLTVVVMSYPKSSRFHLLEQIIRKVSSWEFVWEVLLVWNGDPRLLPDNIKRTTAAYPSKPLLTPPYGRGTLDQLYKRRMDNRQPFFSILPQTHNRVDNRWRIADHIDTDAILNMDDDINLHVSGAQCMLNVWRASPSSLVAIDVRSHFVHAKSGGGPFGAFGYVARDRSAGFKQYSIALPRALLTNRAYYVAYDAAWANRDDSASTPKSGKGVKQIVDELLCDDIAFNFVAAKTSLPSNEQLPGGHVIYVKAKYTAYPESHSADGMTKKEGMKAMRQKCVNELAKHVGGGAGDIGTNHDGMLLLHRPWHVLCDVDG